MSAGDGLFPDANSIRTACEQRQPESLTLEFKEKSESANPIPNRDDRKNIAKSVSAMANGQGGVIVFGVKTDKLEGIDSAIEVKPIADIVEFQKQFETAIYSGISPEIKTVTSRAVVDDDVPNSGFLVCEVQTSPDRPHMSTVSGQHTYYRRSFQGDLPMTPQEVKEQILAIRDAQLRLSIKRGGGSFGWHGDWIAQKVDFMFYLENFGQRMCKNPFLRVAADPFMSSYGQWDTLTSRHKTELAPGILLHVGDSLSAITLSAHARILKAALLLALQTADRQAAFDSIKIFDGNGDLHAPTIHNLNEIEGIELNVMFGAENAATRKVEVSLGADELRRAAFHGAIGPLVEHWGGRQWPATREAEFFGNDDFELLID